MKKTSNNMQKMYKLKRQKTLTNIQNAIDEIQEDNRIVTKKELIELTGLSSGTFSQDHVKSLLRENRVCQYRDKQIIASENNEKLQEKHYDSLIIENNKLLSQIQDFEIVIESNNEKYLKLRNNYRELESENQLLRGKYQQTLEYLDALGANLDSLPLI